MGVLIRAVDPGGETAAALVADFFAEIAARYPAFDPARQPPAPVDAFTPARSGVFLVATLDGIPVACGGVQRLDDVTGEVRRVYVAASARGLGIGRALLEGLVDAARDLGYERLRLDTGDRLPEARRLFLTAGFSDIEDYNGNPFAAHWMERLL